jgi:hypothetical protein
MVERSGVAVGVPRRERKVRSVTGIAIADGGADRAGGGDA